MKSKIVILCAWIFFSFQLNAQDSLQLSMQEAIEYAREHNFDKQTARFNIDIAAKKVKETIGIGLPQVGASAGYTNNVKLRVQPFGDQLFTLGQKHNGSAGFGVNQLLFDGSYIVGIQSTKAYKKITELQALKTDEALVSALTELYAAIIVSQETLKIFKENLRTLDKNLHDVDEIYKVGLGEEQSVEQMTYNRNIMTNSIQNTENLLKVMYENFKYILNIEESTPLKLTTTFDEILKENTDLVDESSISDFSNHIDMRIAENKLTTDKLQLKFQKSKFLPNLSAFYNTDWTSFSDKFDLWDQKWYNTAAWGISLNFPIFNGLQKVARVQQARYQVDISELNRQKTERELNANAKVSFLNFQNALLQFDLAQQQVNLSESIYNKEKIKFFEGLGSSLDLTQAESQLFISQTQLIQSVSDVVDKKIALDKALGNFNLTIN